MKGWVGVLIAALAVAVAFLIICLVASPVSASPIYITQNDQATIHVANPAGTCWYFPSSEKLEQTKLYDIPVLSCGGDSCCTLDPEQTANMQEGPYNFVYTYPSKIVSVDIYNQSPKYIKDLSWKDTSLVSIFGNRTDEAGKQAASVLSDLKQLTSESRTDKYEENQLIVQAPSLTITRQEPINDHLMQVSGTSNMANDTVVKIEIDKSNHEILGDSAKFTFTDARIARTAEDPSGVWISEINISISNLSPGWHETTASANGLITTARFPINSVDVAWTAMPTPKQYVNYFSNGSIKPDVVTVTVVQIQTQIVDRWHTATPTPDITDAFGGKIDYPYKASDEMPILEATVGLVALGILVGATRRE